MISEAVLSSILIGSITCISVIFLVFPIVSYFLKDILSEIIKKYAYTLGYEVGFKSSIKYGTIPKELFNRDIQRMIGEIEKRKKRLEKVYLGGLPVACLFTFSISLFTSIVLLLLPAINTQLLELLEGLTSASFLVGIILFILIGTFVTKDVMYIISIKQKEELEKTKKGIEKYKKSEKFRKFKKSLIKSHAKKEV